MTVLIEIFADVKKLPRIFEHIEEAKDIVNLFARQVTPHEWLRNQQGPNGTALVPMCATRFSSMYKMLRSLQQNKQALINTVVLHGFDADERAKRIKSCVLSEAWWALNSCLVELMVPVAQLLTAIQADHANLPDVHYGLAIVDKWFGDATSGLFADAPALAESMANPFAGVQSNSLYVTMALFLMCVPGIWSQVKRAPVANKKRKTFEVDGPKRANAMPVRDRAKQIVTYFKKYNYEVKEMGEVITFAGLYKADRGQAAAVTFYTFVGMASIALVLSTIMPESGNWWYALTLLSPAAWFYYFQKGERVEEVRVKMVTADNEETTDITVEGDIEEITRFSKARFDRVSDAAGPETFKTRYFELISKGLNTMTGEDVLQLSSKLSVEEQQLFEAGRISIAHMDSWLRGEVLGQARSVHLQRHRKRTADQAAVAAAVAPDANKQQKAR
ncbi:hypothetical protein QJQ45_005710 [Haematococcus lacustris]|nr:hypothetical protein QJQ45_005710 [Haematococcus lacustris]